MADVQRDAADLSAEIEQQMDDELRFEKRGWWGTLDEG